MTALAAGRRIGWAPGVNVRVDHAHQLASGLGLAGVFNSVVFPNASVSSDSTLQAESAGQKWAAPAGVKSSRGVPFPAQDDSTSFTLALCTSKPAGSVVYGIGFNNTTGGPGISYIRLGVGSTSAYMDYISDSTNSSTNGGIAADPPCSILVGVKDKLVLTLYNNGRRVSTRTRPTGTLTTNSATCYYGSDSSSSAAANIAGWFWPNRALTHNEICILTANPFGMFKTP